MNFAEAFYLHISGEQRGPYTIPQIDHLLHSGLIGEETLYWREGLEQWQPVTSLIALRKRPRRWVRPLIVAGLLLALSVPAQIFGPVVIIGWREANQHDYAEDDAYWRARDVVRNHSLPKGAIVDFNDFASAKVELKKPDQAQVQLSGDVTDATGQAHTTVWNIAMQYDRETKEWSGSPVTEGAVK